MSEKLIKSAKADVEKALAETYEVSGKTYRDTVSKARKHLPHRIKKEAEFLDEIERKTKHPRLRRQIKPKEIQRARDRVLAQAKGANPAKDRSRARFGWASTLVINLIAAAILYYLLLRWIGAV